MNDVTRSHPTIGMTVHKTRIIASAAALGLCLVSARCGGDSPTSPSAPVSLTGTWTGTLQSTISGTGTARVTFAQSGSSLAGTWSVAATSVAAANGGLSVTLSPSDPLTCPFQVTATVNGNRITGTYAAFNCTVALSGSISLTRS